MNSVQCILRYTENNKKGLFSYEKSSILFKNRYPLSKKLLIPPARSNNAC